MNLPLASSSLFCGFVYEPATVCLIASQAGHVAVHNNSSQWGGGTLNRDVKLAPHTGSCSEV